MPNDDYILRSDALKAIQYENWREENRAPSIEELHLTEYQLLAEAINKIPAADVVPAPVRCSDCRFYDKRDGGAPGGTGWCSRPGAGCGVPEEFFCAGAERKEVNNV